MWEHTGDVLVHVTMGIGLAACAGLRAFLPLFVVGLAGRLDLVTLSDSFTWLSDWPALAVFGAAVVIEILGDKFPFVDHVLDTVQTFVKPIAGALVMATVIDDWAPLYVAIFSIVVGGSTAGLVHLTKAKLRLASSVTTAGLGNPVLSASEDVGALAGTVGSIVIPPVTVLFMIVTVLLAWVALRRLRRRPA
jgi:hypothetical protein